VSADELTLIVNPGANRFRSAHRIAEAETVLRRRDVRYQVIQSDAYEDIEVQARRARDEGSPVVVACGGDGTNRAVAAALAGTEARMGVLPCGRGNDLARALGIPVEPEAAIDTILNGGTRLIDLGYAGDICFTTVATLGIDSEVSERVRRQRSGATSRLTYPLTLLKVLFQYQFPRVLLEGDFGRREGRIVAAAAANTAFYGGGMRIAPPADPTDGLFHVCFIRAFPRLKLLALFPTVYRGSHVERPEVEMLQTRALRVSSERPLPLYGDGEPLGTTPIEMEVRPQALRVCVPKEQAQSTD
jgi:diacylglycerol kinase (ATP)